MVRRIMYKIVRKRAKCRWLQNQGHMNRVRAMWDEKLGDVSGRKEGIFERQNSLAWNRQQAKNVNEMNLRKFTSLGLSW